jgi:hypothetical protein
MAHWNALVRAFAAVALLLVAPLAHAQTPEATVARLVAEAMADYDQLELESAQTALAEAIRLTQERDLRTPDAAQAWIMSGVINYALTGDGAQALNPFVEGLLIDYNAEISPFYATPTLNEIMGQARMIVPAPGPDPAPTPPPAPVQPTPAPGPPPAVAAPRIGHTPVRNGNAGQAIAIRASIPIEVPAARIVLNFKGLRDPSFFALELAPQPDGISFAGEIPASATAGQVQIEYFIAAFDRAGNLLASTANDVGPITITLFGGFDAPSARDRNARDRGGRERSPRDRGSDERGMLMHPALSFGTGFGLATQPPEANGDRVDLNPGLASTPTHLGLEWGIAPTRGALHLVPFVRLQLVSLDTGLEIEPLGGLKVRYYLRTDRKFRLYAQGGLGYGNVVHFVSLPDIDDGVIDTTIEGPVHVGGGVGFAYFFNPHVALQVDSYLMAMFSRTSVQLDVAAGLMFAF